MNAHKESKPIAQSSESGFTLMESLMAIVVLTIMLVGIAPFIVLATATRVQARRVELATQAARTYIDAVRSGAVPAPNIVVPPPTGLTANPTTADQYRTNANLIRTAFANIAPPAGNAWTNNPTCTPPTTTPPPPSNIYPYCVNTNPRTVTPTAAPIPATATASNAQVSLFCVDFDGGGCSPTSRADMIVQAYRSSTTPVGSLSTEQARQREIDRGYLLGVRVYRADAFETSDRLLSRSENPQYRQRSSGNALNRKMPLIEMTTEITGTVDNSRFQGYCDRFGGC